MLTELSRIYDCVKAEQESLKELEGIAEEIIIRPPKCRCGMFQRKGTCWHVGYDPRKSSNAS